VPFIDNSGLFFDNPRAVGDVISWRASAGIEKDFVAQDQRAIRDGVRLRIMAGGVITLGEMRAKGMVMLEAAVSVVVGCASNG